MKNKRLRKILRLYLASLAVLISVLLGLFAARMSHLAVNEKSCLWPAVTICRLCDHRIWVWEDYERREHKPPVHNPERLAIFITRSSIFHVDCKGEPEFEPIKVRTVPSEVR